MICKTSYNKEKKKLHGSLIEKPPEMLQIKGHSQPLFFIRQQQTRSLSPLTKETTYM